MAVLCQQTVTKLSRVCVLYNPVVKICLQSQIAIHKPYVIERHIVEASAYQPLRAFWAFAQALQGNKPITPHNKQNET
jgi:hypothetical protein